MKRRRWYLTAGVAAGLLAVAGTAGADLWRDHNPYSAAGPVVQGTVLKLTVSAPFEILYEYEQDRDDRVTIKMQPDQKLTPFLPPASSDKAVTGKGRVRIRARSRLRLKLAVTVDAIRPGNVAAFSGSRVIGYEADRAVQQLQVRGLVQVGDISTRREIHSQDVADLQLTIRGEPVRRSRELPMKTKPGEPGQPPVPSAELNDREKQQLLLEYLNRLLGELEDR